MQTHASSHYSNNAEYNAYRKRQKKRIIIALCIILVVAVMAISAITYFAVGFIKDTAAYKVAIKEVLVNKEIQDKTGGIKGLGDFPSGNISVSDDSGTAIFEISVNGEKHDVEVHLKLHKNSNSDWIVDSITVNEC